MLPPAPALFSITNGCFSAVESFSAITRAKVSSGPGTVLTITFTGRLGYPDCAVAQSGSPAETASTSRDDRVCMDRFLRSGAASRGGKVNPLQLRVELHHVRAGLLLGDLAARMPEAAQ